MGLTGASATAKVSIDKESTTRARQKLETKFTCPDDSVCVTMGVVVTSRKGSIFIGDMSLSCEDKELLKKPGIEDR